MSLIFPVSRILSQAVWICPVNRQWVEWGNPLLSTWPSHLLSLSAQDPALLRSFTSWSLAPNQAVGSLDVHLPSGQQPFKFLSKFPIVCEPRHTELPRSTSNSFWTVYFFGNNFIEIEFTVSPIKVFNAMADRSSFLAVLALLPHSFLPLERGMGGWWNPDMMSWF